MALGGVIVPDRVYAQAASRPSLAAGGEMKTAWWLLLAGALASAPASAELDLRRAEVTHLPNGLTVLLLEDHSLPLVSVQTLYKSGSAAETTGKTGLAHFLEHLVFR